MKYALVNSSQVVVDVIEYGGTEILAPEGGFIAETSMFQKGDYYGVTGAPTFGKIEASGAAPAPSSAEAAPEDVPPVPEAKVDEVSDAQ